MTVINLRPSVRTLSPFISQCSVSISGYLKLKLRRSEKSKADVRISEDLTGGLWLRRPLTNHSTEIRLIIKDDYEVV